MIDINNYIVEKLKINKNTHLSKKEISFEIGEILKLDTKYEDIVNKWVNKFKIKSFKIYARTAWRPADATPDKLKDNDYTSTKIIHDYEHCTKFLEKTAHYRDTFKTDWVEMINDSEMTIRYFEDFKRTLCIIPKNIEELQFIIEGSTKKEDE